MEERKSDPHMLELLRRGRIIAMIDKDTGRIIWKHITYATDEDLENALSEDEVLRLYGNGESE